MQNIDFCLSRILIFTLALLSLGAAHGETVLRYTDHEPYGNMRTRAIQDLFFSAIEKESNGRVRVEPHWNGELAISYEALPALQKGEEADIGIVVPEYSPQQLPLFQLFKSFPLGPETGAKQVQFFQNVFHDLPQFNTELAQNNLVNLQFFLGYPAAFFNTQPGLALNKLKRTTWRTASFWHQAFLEQAGAKVVKMPWNERITQALKAGELNGVLVNLDSGDDIHAQQAAKYVQFSPRLWLGHVYLLVMNKTRWEALSAEDKAAIQRAAQSTQQALGPLLDRSINEMITKMTRQGAEVKRLTPDALRAWQQASQYQQQQKKWLAEKGGKDAEHLLPLIASRLEDAMR